jgi:hypothetical protein
VNKTGLILIDCACGGKRCRARSVRIDPEEGHLWIEIEYDSKKPTTEALMYLDKKEFKALIEAGQRGLKKLAPR